MLQRNLCATAVMLACASFSYAASPNELDEIRQQIAAMKAQYEARISYLESQLESKLAQAQRPPPPANSTPDALPDIVSARTRGFNPEISLILDSKFASTQHNPNNFRIQGFVPNGGEIVPPARGFSLGETELAISGSIDHLFRANARFSIADEGGASVINTEEAHIETLGLGDGFKVKAGRFLSGIGYLNAQHPHEWDFVDAPLAYKAFWGSRLSQDGAQLKWLAPTDLYLELGGESAHGASFPGSSNERSTPATNALFAHLGGDWNPSNAWQTGLSYIRANARNRLYTDSTEAQNAFEGTSQTWIADFVWKWVPDGNSSIRSLKLQSELFSRTETGDMTYHTTATDDFQSKQTGGYAQTVYQFMPKWRVGYRYDWLNSGHVHFGPALSPANFAELSSYAPRRHSVMVDWSPSEFSRLRLQLAHDQSRGEGLGDKQLFLQYIMNLGAHGAHKF